MDRVYVSNHAPPPMLHCSVRLVGALTPVQRKPGGRQRREELLLSPLVGGCVVWSLRGSEKRRCKEERRDVRLRRVADGPMFSGQLNAQTHRQEEGHDPGSSSI